MNELKEIRAKYPNAYIKWDTEADAQLLGAGDAETADAAMHYTSRRKLVTDVDRQEH